MRCSTGAVTLAFGLLLRLVRPGLGDQYMRKWGIVALGVVASLGFAIPAHAQSSPDASQVTEVLKKLEARVSALEAENQQSKKEAAAARAEAQALRQKLDARKSAAPALAAAPANTILAVPPSARPYEVKGPVAPVRPAWSGLYVGAAGGIGLLHGDEALNETTGSTSTLASGAFSAVTALTSTETASLSGRNPGAMSSLFLGYNSMPMSNWLIGGQLEGTLANSRVNLNGSGSSTSASSSVTTPPGGAAGTTTTIGTGLLSGLPDTLDNRWLISVLARTGYLIDPSDLVYVIGGYTYGRFEADANGFGMNGGTIGIGWERQIISGWDLRAEYRYTRFGSKTVSLAEASSSTSSSTGAGAGPSALTSDLAGAFRFSDVDMHSVWLGVSYSFGP